MLASLKALRSAINVATFPDDGETETAAKALIDRMNDELSDDADGVSWEEGTHVVAATEQLNMALDQIAAEVDSDDEVEEDEEEEVVE